MAFLSPNSPTSSSENGDNGTKKLLLQQMLKARRAGAWFRLPRIERVMYELAMRLNVKLLSHDLLKALVSVLRSLREISDRGYALMTRATSIAWGYSEFAFKAGNENARKWRNDRDFIGFLALGLETSWVGQ